MGAIQWATTSSSLNMLAAPELDGLYMCSHLASGCCRTQPHSSTDDWCPFTLTQKNHGVTMGLLLLLLRDGIEVMPFNASA